LPVAFRPNTARRAAKNACLPAVRQAFLPAPRGLFGANTIFRIPVTGCAAEFFSRLTHPPVRARDKETPFLFA